MKLHIPLLTLQSKPIKILIFCHACFTFLSKRIPCAVEISCVLYLDNIPFSKIQSSMFYLHPIHVFTLLHHKYIFYIVMLYLNLLQPVLFEVDHMTYSFLIAI